VCDQETSLTRRLRWAAVPKNTIIIIIIKGKELKLFCPLLF
jgi:hypothetical protein